MTRQIVVPLVHGVHARPAARIAAAARAFGSHVELVRGERRADARSSVALLGLGLKRQDTVEIRAQGPDAAAAVSAIAALIEGGMGEAGPAPAPRASPRPALAETRAPFADAPDGTLRGVAASPGVAVGPALRLQTREIAVPEAGAGCEVERQALARARAEVRARLSAARTAAHGAAAEILVAHQDFLDDPALASEAEQAIAAGKSAGFAWRSAVRGQAQVLQGSADARTAERAADLLDLETQVLRALCGEAETLIPGDVQGAILIADDLLPSQLIGLAPGAVGGLCTARGGPTSHVAILAAAMGIPALVAAGAGVLEIADGALVILDADARRLHPAPSADAVASARAAIAARAHRRAAAAAAASEPAVTRDGVRIAVFANIGSLADAEAAARSGAEGVGLLRTEFLFLERDEAPDEDEQARAYQAIADALGGRPLIVRTLDIGGDKPAAYLPMPAEENPALGLRGVRIGLWRPAMLKAQLRAILRVRPLGVCRIMLPMVSSLSELTQVRAWLDEARDELEVETPVELGVMVETPAAAATADILAREADFLSIGTNDLTQYVLAMDRGHPELAARSDAMHPAVLRLIARTCEGAAAHGRWTGVCGGLASDLLAAPLLIGLGVSELSCTPSAVAEVKARVRSASLADCRELARQALDAASPQEVRALAARFDLQGPRP